MKFVIGFWECFREFAIDAQDGPEKSHGLSHHDIIELRRNKGPGSNTVGLCN